MLDAQVGVDRQPGGGVPPGGVEGGGQFVDDGVGLGVQAQFVAQVVAAGEPVVGGQQGSAGVAPAGASWQEDVAAA